MADDKKTKKATVYNTAEGPRSIFGVDGVNHIIRPGESVTAEFQTAELSDMTEGLTTTKPKAEGEEPGPAPAGPTADAAAIARDAEVLSRANDRDALLDIAKKEKVSVETDDNKDQLALKIAQKRAGVEPE